MSKMSLLILPGSTPYSQLENQTPEFVSGLAKKKMKYEKVNTF